MRPAWTLALGLVAALGLAACGDETGPTPSPALHLAPVDSGYDFPVFVTAPPGDPSRLLVVERAGRILLRKSGVRQDSAFLNLTNLTSPASGEYGVYSLAFHPDYAANGRLFVYYVTAGGNARLSEFTATPDRDHAIPASEQPVLEQPEDPDALLYGGMIAFGPDGYLYLALGDTLTGDLTTGITPAQDSASLLGKMLRIAVDQPGSYTVPPDNPFLGRAGWRPEIWSLGWRNPWRWSFDRQTGELWAGDVGEHAQEEIDLEPAGAGGRNYGWPRLEGTQCYRPAVGCTNVGLTPPVATISHGSSVCSLTGGYVYRGRRFPALDGVYFYGDYCGGWVRNVRRIGTTLTEAFPALASPLVNDNVVSFGEDSAGELYVVMASGRIYRIEA